MKTAQEIMLEALQEKYDDLAFGVNGNIGNLLDALNDIERTPNNGFYLDRAIYSAEQIKEYANGDEE